MFLATPKMCSRCSTINVDDVEARGGAGSDP